MNASPLITVFVVGVLAIVFIGVIAGQSNNNTKLTVQVDTISIASARTTEGINTSKPLYLSINPAITWRADYSECQPSTIVLANVTGGAFTVTTDYTYSKQNGTLYLLNTTAVNGVSGGSSNTTTANYLMCPNGYMTQSWGRSVSNLVVGFLVIMLLIAFVYGLYQYLPRNE